MATDLMNTIPEELQPEFQGLSRQQQMAQMLMQQAFQQPQGQMVSGRYVAPGLLQQLQPLAAAYIGSKGMEAAENKQLELAKAIRTQGDAAVTDVMETFKTDPNLGLQKALKYQQFPQVKAVLPTLAKSLEPTPEERKYQAAIRDKSFKGGFNEFINQMSEKDKADLRIQNARLGLAQQEQAFNLGLPVGGSGGAPSIQPPMQTIAPGSPILAPGQQSPMQLGTTETMPRFRSKAEQDIWVATQKEAGKLKAEALNALPGALQTVQSGLEAINGMIGDTTVDKNGKLVYGKTQPHPGFSGAVGISGIGSGFGAAGFIPGTDVKDFQSRFKQVEGQAFLGAINTLRGTGAISEVEGAKATAALNRMNLSQSEAEFVKAANEFKDVLQKGYAAAQQRAGLAPINLNIQPSSGGSSPRYVYDPATGTLK